MRREQGNTLDRSRNNELNYQPGAPRGELRALARPGFMPAAAPIQASARP
jgi:hypothetical protein